MHLTVVCCDSVMVEGFDGQTSRQGLYTKMADGTTYNGSPVYTNADGDNQLWNSGDAWYIGGDYTSGSFGIASAVSIIVLSQFPKKNVDERMETTVLKMGWAGATMMEVTWW